MKKALKRAFLIGILLGLGAFLLRGPLFRLMITYEEGEEVRKANTALGEILEDDILEWTDQNGDAEGKEIMFFAQEKTAELLSFKLQSASNYNAFYVAQTGEANCIGYAVLCMAIAEKAQLELYGRKKYSLEHRRGEMPLLGIRWQYLDEVPAWLKNHDYVLVRDDEGEVFMKLDPTLYDYLRIKRVR